MEGGDYEAETFMEFVYSQNGFEVDDLLKSDDDGVHLIQLFLNGLK